MGRGSSWQAPQLYPLALAGLCLTLLGGLALLVTVSPGSGQASGIKRPATSSLLRTPTPTRTRIPFPTPTRTPTPKPTPTPFPTPTATPSTTTTPQPTATITPTATSATNPTATPTFPPQPTVTSTLTPAATQNQPTATSTSLPAAGGKATGGNADSAAPPSAPPWLVGGLGALFGSLLLFGLIAFPLSRRLARNSNRGRTGAQPALRRGQRPPLQDEMERYNRLSQFPVVRHEPLTQEQLFELHTEQERRAGASKESSGSLSAVQLMDGVPVTLPIIEQNTIPRLPTVSKTSGKRPVVGLIVEGTSGEQQAVPKPELLD